MAVPPIKLAAGKNGTIYDLGDGSVAKVFARDTAAKTIEREAITAKLAIDSGLPTPKILDVQTGGICKQIRFEKIQGEPLSLSVLKRPWKVIWASREMAKCLVKIHAVTDTQIRDLQSELIGQIKKAPILSEGDKQDVITQLKTLKGKNCLCHFDFHSGNVMVTRQKCLVIDWGAAILGPPLADLTQSYVINRIDGFPEQSTVLTRWLIQALRALHIEMLIAFYAWISHDHSYRSIKRGIRLWLRPIAAARLADEIPYETEPLLALLDKKTR